LGTGPLSSGSTLGNGGGETSVGRVVGIVVAVGGAILVVWNLVGRGGLPADSARRFSGAMTGGLFIAVGIFVLLYWG
jgi:hypothetical protein